MITLPELIVTPLGNDTAVVPLAINEKTGLQLGLFGILLIISVLIRYATLSESMVVFLAFFADGLVSGSRLSSD